MDPPPSADGFYREKCDGVRKKKRGRQKETVINKQPSVSTGLWSCFCLCVLLLVPEGAGAHKAGAGRGLTEERTKPKCRIQAALVVMGVSIMVLCDHLCFRSCVGD